MAVAVITTVADAITTVDVTTTVVVAAVGADQGVAEEIAVRAAYFSSGMNAMTVAQITAVVINLRLLNNQQNVPLNYL
jgi:hypothetical protein